MGLWGDGVAQMGGHASLEDFYYVNVKNKWSYNILILSLKGVYYFFASLLVLSLSASYLELLLAIILRHPSLSSSKSSAVHSAVL